MSRSEPWDCAFATEEIRRIAKEPLLTLVYKKHAQDRLGERGLIVSDILYALKNGFVYEKAVPAMKPDGFRYLMESKTPNSGSRSIGIVVIPSTADKSLKVVTVMWIDELERIAGTIRGIENE